MKYYFTFIVFSLFTLFKSVAQDTTTVQPADSSAFVAKQERFKVEAQADPKQEGKREVYKIKKGVDIPLFLIAGGWAGYNFTKIYSKDPSTQEEIESLDRNNVSAFNRSAIDHYNLNSKHVGDLFFYGSSPRL